MNQHQKEIMANMMWATLMMFANTLSGEERTNFARHLIKGLEGFIAAPVPAQMPVVAPAPVHFAKGPPTEPMWNSVLPTIPEIKFDGKIWDSKTMIPQNDLPLRADSPAYVPRM